MRPSLAACTLALVALAFLPLPVGAQLEIHVPNNQPGVGTCNVYPFGSTTFTYAARVPVSFLAPLHTVVQELSFAPCNSGTWSCATGQMGLGHVPSPIPVPFTFPSFDQQGNLVGLGSFLDYTPLWNSVAQGPFNWPYQANTWVPMGFSAAGGTGFVWNGINDIAYFVTLQGATGTSPFHRTDTEPFRVDSSGVYQATTSSGSGPSGLKMRLYCLPATPTLPLVTAVGLGCSGSGGLTPTLTSAALPFLGNTSFSVDVNQAPASSQAYLFASIGLAPAPVTLGGGCILYLDLGSMLALMASGFFPFGPLPTSSTGSTNFLLPVPSDPTLAGGTVGLQAAILDAAAPLGLVLTNALDLLLN